VAELLEKNGKQKIRLIGYDILDENLKYLRTGTIDFLINQNPKRQAFLSISHLANHLVFKKCAPKQDLFPLEVITQQNLDSYLQSGIH
jgi:LacI family transcriptional regulator